MIAKLNNNRGISLVVVLMVMAILRTNGAVSNGMTALR
jgi:hypothetical protein